MRSYKFTLNSMPRVHAGVFIAGLMLTAGACWALQSGAKLFFDSKVVTSDLRTINGKTYVPLADVASAMDMHLDNVSGGIKLVRNGGGDPLKGLHAVIGGQEIFTGRWRIWFRSLQQTDEYVMKYDSDHTKVTPKNPGDTLYVMDVRLKNGTPEKAGFHLQGDGETALTDNKEHGFDAYKVDSNESWPSLLPGAAYEFAIIFSVPKDATPKDIVYGFKEVLKDKVTLRIDLPKDQ